MNDALLNVPTSYAADFEEARIAFLPPQNDSKFGAYKAWSKTVRVRMACGAFGNRMTECCRLYHESTRREKQFKKHMATWLNGRGWEDFMAEAEANLTRISANALKGKMIFDGWEAEAEQLIKELTDSKFSTWFEGVTVKRGKPTEIIFPSHFRANYVAKNFPYALRRAFSECRLTAIGSAQKFDL